jgi:hypothetical protein
MTTRVSFTCCGLTAVAGVFVFCAAVSGEDAFTKHVFTVADFFETALAAAGEPLLPLHWAVTGKIKIALIAIDRSFTFSPAGSIQGD